MGDTVKIGYFSQSNEYMDEKLKVIDYVKEVGEYIETVDGKVTASKMLERFLFDGTMQYQLISKLSGGEKRRLYLLRILMASPNVLILDEPTNDLDIATLNILEQYLDEFPGIVITVSHDRYFLDRTVQRIFAFENNNICQYEGNFTDYQNAARSKGVLADSSVSRVEKKNDGKTERVREKKLKFTYQEQKEFDTIDEDIADLEKKIEQKDVEMGQAATDFGKLRILLEEKEALEEMLNYKMERWVILQEIYEKIQNL